MESHTYLPYPLYYVRSGWININGGIHSGIGSVGDIWSSSAAALTSYASAATYHIALGANQVSPSGGPSNRYLGFPLRCREH